MLRWDDRDLVAQLGRLLRRWGSREEGNAEEGENASEYRGSIQYVHQQTTRLFIMSTVARCSTSKSKPNGSIDNRLRNYSDRSFIGRCRGRFQRRYVPCLTAIPDADSLDEEELTVIKTSACDTSIDKKCT